MIQLTLLISHSSIRLNHQWHNRCIRYQFHRLFNHINTITHHHSHQHFRVHYIKHRVHIRNRSYPLLCNHMLEVNTGDRLHQPSSSINKYVLDFETIAFYIFFHDKQILFLLAIAIPYVSSVRIWKHLSAAGMASIKFIFPLPVAKVNKYYW